jgi:chemotaxis protein methyltransferase CheR
MVAILSSAELGGLAKLLRARIGFQLPDSRLCDLQAAAQRVLSWARVPEGGSVVQAFGEDAAAFDALVSAVTIGETYFFRDPGQLDLLRDRVIPQLRALRSPSHSLALWSAGCASGEEAYTLAALMAESGLGPYRVLGTDVCGESLARAKRASYGAWSLRGQGRERMSAYLRQSQRRWHVLPALRDRVEFRAHNLAGSGAGWAGLRDMDLILCRNVMIYFGPETVRDVALRLFECLAPGGVLLTGPSDPLLGGHAPFIGEVTPFGLLYRRPAPGQPLHAPASIGTHAGAIRSPSDMVLPPEAETPQRACMPAASRQLDRARSGRSRLDTRGTRASPALQSVELPPDALAGPYLEAMRLLAERDAVGAERQLRRLLYEDRRQPVLHFGLGVALVAQGRVEAARRAFRNAETLASELVPGQLIRLGDGVTAGQLAQAAHAHLVALPARGG